MLILRGLARQGAAMAEATHDAMTQGVAAKVEAHQVEETRGSASQAQADQVQAAQIHVAHAKAMADLGQGFSKLARTVRQTLAMEARLQGEGEARAFAARAPADRARREAAEQACYVREAMAHGYQAHLEEAVEETIEAEAEGEAAEQLLADFHERLEDDDMRCLLSVANVDSRPPLSQVITDVCRHLGVTPDWEPWSAMSWATKEGREGVLGSFYVERRRRRTLERADRAAQIAAGTRPKPPPRPKRRWDEDDDDEAAMDGLG